MALYHIVSYSMYCIILHGIPLYCEVLHSIVLQGVVQLISVSVNYHVVHQVILIQKCNCGTSAWPMKSFIVDHLPRCIHNVQPICCSIIFISKNKYINRAWIGWQCQGRFSLNPLELEDGDGGLGTWCKNLTSHRRNMYLAPQHF